MTADEALLTRLANGETLSAADDLSPQYRGEIVRLMSIFVDTEMAWAAGYADFINRAPGMRERVVAARIVAEKLDHAERVLSLQTVFGVRPELYIREHAWTARLDRNVRLGNRRVGDDKRLNVLHYPLEGWTDAVVMNALMGPATVLHLTELAGSSYLPLADVMGTIVEREAEHARLAERGVAQAIERQGAGPAQAAADYWYPRIADSFGRLDSDRFDQYSRYGLRKATNAELLALWQEDTRDLLGRLELQVSA